MTKIHLHHGDLPNGLDLGPVVAVDTETMGLQPWSRDRLCLVQLSAGDGTAHLVKFNGLDYDAPNLCRLLEDEEVLKLYHFARFDIAAIACYLDVLAAPLFCTRTASKLVRTFTDKHGLKDLCREMLGVEISKQEQSSDWGAETLTDAQKSYAANDVLYLHRLKDKLEEMLEREGRTELAHSCFDFIPSRALLDIAGWAEHDIFAH